MDERICHMRCSGCGQPLEAGTTVCLRCGTPVPSDRVVAGLLPDEQRSDDSWAIVAGPTSPYGPYSTTEPPPPPLYSSGAVYAVPYPKPEPWSKRLRVPIIAFVVLLALAAAGLGSYELVQAKIASRNTSSLTTGNLGTQMLAGTRCPLLVADAGAAANLEYVQLTSGLKDAARGDYEPIDRATNFVAGQTIYSTFTVATNNDATISAEWCWGKDGQTASYSLHVAKERNIGGYFALNNIGTQDVGQGVLTIRWNSQPAYVLIFTVQSSATPQAGS
jgi:hypothetical protein